MNCKSQPRRGSFGISTGSQPINSFRPSFRISGPPPDSPGRWRGTPERRLVAQTTSRVFGRAARVLRSEPRFQALPEIVALRRRLHRELEATPEGFTIKSVGSWWVNNRDAGATAASPRVSRLAGLPSSKLQRRPRARLRAGAGTPAAGVPRVAAGASDSGDSSGDGRAPLSRARGRRRRPLALPTPRWLGVCSRRRRHRLAGNRLARLVG